jgi:selenocysteine-specific elongation factor
MPVILGTAGHIDHGKTTLVHRLTGVDTDRLPEEKKRGITIVLGFAPLVLSNGTRIGVIDVPGHERFVKNMVAGAGGIDVAMLVVAADEGVMPQTREHLEICGLLGIKNGVIALTKIDRAGKDLSELAAEDVRNEVKGTFLEAAPLVPVSAVTGEGIEALKETIEKVVKTIAERRESDLLLLPIDRVFSMHGFGSVITGTLISGTLAVGDAVEVLPPIPGRPITEPARVRGIQSFKEKKDRAFAGERTAVNLQGVELDKLALGQVLVTPGAAHPTNKIGVRLTYLKSRTKPLKTGARVLFHTGTALVEAGVTLIGTDQIEPGETTFAHVLLKQAIATLPGQRFIARGFDAVEKAGRTIAGGVILDPHPGRRRRQARETIDIMDRLFALQDRGPGDGRLEAALVALVSERGQGGLEIDEVARRLGARRPKIEKAASTAESEKLIVRIGDRLVASAALRALQDELLGLVESFHREHPYKPAIALAELESKIGGHVPGPVVERAAAMLAEKKKIVRDAEGLRSASRTPARETNQGAKANVVAALEVAKLEPPALALLEQESGLSGTAFRDLMASMVKSGEIVHAAQQLYFGKLAFDGAKDKVLAFIAQKGEISTAQAKEILGVSRKFLIPLLEAMDKAQVTVRVGEVRKAKVRAPKP